MTRRILITGGTGRLGSHLKKLAPGAFAPSHSEMDLTEGAQVADCIAGFRPEIVFHCAALTDVRRCEKDHVAAWAANVVGTRNLVHACAKFCPELYFIYVSTACVFDGETGNYTEGDVPFPKNFYGYTKVIGECLVSVLATHLIARTNFVPRLKWPFPAAFVDRFGTYLFADEAAAALISVAEKKTTGIVHICGDERLSMWELARVTTPEVNRMSTEGFDIPVTRDMTLKSVRIPPFRIRRSAV